MSGELIFGIIVVIIFVIILFNASLRHMSKMDKLYGISRQKPSPDDIFHIEHYDILTDNEIKQHILNICRNNPNRNEWWLDINGKLYHIKRVGN